MSTEQHKKLLGENVTKTYKKAPPKLQRSINLEAKLIATEIKLVDCIERLTEAPGYVTLKDHKADTQLLRPHKMTHILTPPPPLFGLVRFW